MVSIEGQRMISWNNFELDNRDIETTDVVIGTQVRVTLDTKRFFESVYQVDIDDMNRIHEVIIRELLLTATGDDVSMLTDMLGSVLK